MHGFWDGVAFGAIATILPSLIAFAVLIARAPEIKAEPRELMPATMESGDAGL